MNTTVLTQQPTGTTATIPAPTGRAPRAALLAALLTTSAFVLAAIVLTGSAGASSQGAPLGGISSYSPNVYGWRTVTPITTRDLRDVFMVSTTDGWAVGNVGTVLRYNGTSWSTFPISTSDTLRDVYMVSPTDGYIVAWHTMDSGSDIYHFDGTSWSLQYTSDQFIYRVDATGPNDVWASGFTRIYHNTGSGWSYEEVPGNMFAIDMTSPTQGWATGAYGVILEFSSGSWTPYTGPVQNTLYETFFTSPTDGWAMGYTETTYVLHNNGTTWSRR
jgi:photosystem II stability/assembly factor-like uncharacterized protein